MIATRMFLKDFITVHKAIKYLITLILFGVFLWAFSIEGQNPAINGKVGVSLGICVAFSSTVYVIYTYSKIEKIKLYISLPVNKWRLFLGYFCALFSCTMIQRVSFIIMVLIFWGNSNWKNILLITIASAVAVLINIALFLGKNRNNKGIIIINSIILLALLIVGNSALSIFIQLPVVVFMGGVSIATWKGCDVTDLIIEYKIKDKIFGKTRVSNYFVRVVLSERCYITNTIIIFIFIIVFTFVNRSNLLMWNLAWSIGAINTPFLTMLSGDLFMVRQVDMLPKKKNYIYGQYYSFLIGYFCIANLIIILAKKIIIGGNISFDIVYAVILVVIETIVACYLEENHRIKEWQTKQELWKHPSIVHFN